MDIFVRMLTVAHYYATRAAAKTQKALVCFYFLSKLNHLLNSFLFLSFFKLDIAISFFKCFLYLANRNGSFTAENIILALSREYNFDKIFFSGEDVGVICLHNRSGYKI